MYSPQYRLQPDKMPTQKKMRSQKHFALGTRKGTNYHHRLLLRLGTYVTMLRACVARRTVTYAELQDVKRVHLEFSSEVWLKTVAEWRLSNLDVSVECILFHVFSQIVQKQLALHHQNIHLLMKPPQLHRRVFTINTATNIRKFLI